jgi:hypothetical protein
VQLLQLCRDATRFRPLSTPLEVQKVCVASLHPHAFNREYCNIFQSSSELQNIPEAAPKASPSFSVSERLALYGSSALSGVEHLLTELQSF